MGSIISYMSIEIRPQSLYLGLKICPHCLEWGAIVRIGRRPEIQACKFIIISSCILANLSSQGLCY